MNRPGTIGRDCLGRFLLVSALAVHSISALLTSQAAAADGRRPNILFILADDLGYGDLGCYGQQQIKTPNIDRLAAEGKRFTQCYAGSTVCAPSRCCLMTGFHSGHARIRGNALVPLQPADVTVAGVLKTVGYSTGLIGKWGLGEPGSTGIPNRQGFDVFFGYLNQHHAHNYYPEFLWKNEQKYRLEGNVEKDNIAIERAQYSPDLCTREALGFLDRNRDQPFFLYLAYTLPHANNERGRAEGNGMEIPSDFPYTDRPWPQPQKNHAAMITRLDSDVGQVLARLRELGLEKNTVVFFSSDNGPHKEGGADPKFFQSAGPLRGHKRDLYEGGIRVPMIVRWPGKVERGTSSDQVWAFWDFLPTAAELAGAKAPAGIDGISMAEALQRDRAPRSHEFLYWEFHEGGSSQSVRMGDWKAIRLKPSAPLELYDLKHDIGEANDLAAQHPLVVAKIEAYLKVARTESPDWPIRPQEKNQSRRVHVNIPETVDGVALRPQVLDAKSHHLGIAGKPEWEEFASDPPEAQRLEIHFNAPANSREATLFIRQRDVKLSWDVKLNDRSIGQLATIESSLLQTLAVPAGALREGENTLRIIPPATADDIVLGEVLLDLRPRQDALNRSSVLVQVTDADTGTGLPCRITVVDQRGSLAPFWVSPNERLAVRTGVVYTRDGLAKIGLPEGKYTIYASRGFEYSLAQYELAIAAGHESHVSLSIRREVPTPGLVGCDTHVHTLTYSGHGDATVDERALTLAGEGIELPIATEHNQHADFAPAAERMGVRSFFTPVVGNEVTTKVGHFNAFPFETGTAPADFRLTEWPALMRSIRSGPGERVVILNHPRDLHSNFRSFDPVNFNAITGEHRRWPELGFDAIEVINSGAQQSDLMQPFRDWFALLNHGERITAVGSSDCHDVNRFIVGQGRTYVACPDTDPGHLEVAAACASFHEGRALVSLGLLARLRIDGRFEVGDLATGLGKEMNVEVAVLGPLWVRADRVALYSNGVLIRQQTIDTPADRVEKARVHWTIPRPCHDAHLVAIASGPGITEPYWPIAKPYQPTSRVWRARVMAATNPIWVDGDGDGTYSSPRATAASLIERTGTEPHQLLAALSHDDEAVAVQAASLCHSKGKDVRDPDFARELKSAPEQVRRGFSHFVASLRAP